MIEVKIPENLWEDGAEAAISAWLCESGDSVAAGSVIAEIMIEKTSHELFAPASGVVERLADENDVVVPGQIVARIS